MKAFEDYKIKAEIKTIGYLTTSGAFDAGREIGWRAALKWVKKIGKGGNCGMCYTESVIEDELEK